MKRRSKAMKNAFEFLGIPERSIKPRSRGLTMVIDGLESGWMGINSLQDFLQWASPYIDLMKLGWLITPLLPADFVAKKVEIIKSQGIDPFPGGMLFEWAVVGGKVEETLDEIGRLGFTAMEVSDSVIILTHQQKMKLVKKIHDLGLKVIVEIGKKQSAGGPLNVSGVRRQVEDYLQAGAYKIILDSEQIELIFEEGSEGQSKVDELFSVVEAAGYENILLEVPYGKSFQQLKPILWQLVQHFGADVNLANVEPKNLIAVETFRRGLMSTGFGKIPRLI
jgi:phosphosulfolactate synthase